MVEGKDRQVEESEAGVVRAATAALRTMAREVPRGPWRWGRPELEVGEASLIDTPPAARARLHDDPLDVATEVVPPHPASTMRAGLVRPELADALATMLDQVALGLDGENGDVADGVSRSAVALARIVLRETAAATAH